MATLSIIIPTYNSSKTIKRCLYSILNQSFTDFEILIIDGLSIDNTIEISESFDDPRINIHTGKDKGIYDAMNKGIRFSKGEWLYFLGSDDHLYSETILARIFCNPNLDYDVIYGNVTSPRFCGLYDGLFSEEKLFNKNICHQSIFFQKEVFRITGFFNLKYKTFADWDHNLKWFCCKKIKKKYINEIIAFYADDGFSSHNNDYVFLNDKRWRSIKYNKNQTTVLNKLRMIKLEMKKALKENRKRDALKILLETPYLFF